MRLEEIKAIAKKMDIKPGKVKKAELIKTIQRSEGNFDCFGTPFSGECDQPGCTWKEDCLPAS